MNEISSLLVHLENHHPRSLYQGREKALETLDSLVIQIGNVVKRFNRELLNDEICIQVLQQYPVFIPFMDSYVRLIQVTLDLIHLIDGVHKTRVISVFHEWNLISMDAFLSYSLKSSILNVCRQDWKSNSPFSKGSRITPGLITGVGALKRLCYSLFNDAVPKGRIWSTVKESFLSCAGNYVDTILITYWGMQPSRIRLVQWKNDLTYLLSHVLDILRQLVETEKDRDDREESYNNDIKESVNNLLCKGILLYYQLYILCENDSFTLKSFSDNLLHDDCKNKSSQFQHKSTADLMEMISSLCSAFYGWKKFPENVFKKLDIFPSLGMTYMGQQQLKKSESIITENHGNSFIEARAMHFDEISGAQFMRIPMFLNMSQLLQTQTSLVQQLCLNNGFQTVQYFIRRRSEFLDSDFPVLTAVQEENKQHLSRYLDDTGK
jgi:hypothetical protein